MGAAGQLMGAFCCAGDDLPEGMIWLRHELQLGLHELRCGALGRCGWSCGGLAVVPAGNPQAALLPAPLEGGDFLDGGAVCGTAGAAGG